MTYVEYDSNNSGGRWWLTDQNWLDLEKAGWDVKWYRDEEYYNTGEDGRWLGALAGRAEKHDASLREAITEWEAVTGQDSTDLGCACCGVPHTFTLYDDNGDWKDSYPPSFPYHGDPYDGD